MIEPVTIGQAMDRWTAIYSFEEHDGEVRYVGKTVQYLIERRKAHIRTAKRGSEYPLYRWLRKRRSTVGFVTRLIEHVPPGRDWASREKFWISQYRSRGDRLLNLTDGGEGLPGHKFSAEHRQKLAAAHRTGSHFNCLTCGTQFWRKQKEIKRGHNKYCSRGCFSRRNQS